MRLNTLFIGPHEQVHKTLQTLKPDWNFIPPSDTVQSIPEAIHKVKKDTILREIHALFIQDHLFDDRGDDTDFEDFISTTPHSLIGIVNYYPHLRQKMIDSIREAAAVLNRDLPPLYFISPTNPLRDINDGVLKFLMENDEEEAKRVRDLLIKDLYMKTKSMTNKNLHSGFISI